MDRFKNIILILTVLALAMAWRFPELDLRPMHNDEAVNAIKLGDLWLKGEYKYDPNEYHGPTLHYFTLPFVIASGAKDFVSLSEKTMRSAIVFFAIVSIILIWLLRDFLGKSSVFFAMVFASVSPMFVFYSRYFIHEMLLICFTTVLMVGGIRYLKNPKAGWALFAGIGAGLMFATKETFVLALFAIFVAVLLELLWRHYVEKRSEPPACDCVIVKTFPWIAPLANRIKPSHIIAGVVAFIIVSVLLFTSFFKNPVGIVDSVRTYFPWLERAGGKSPHIHPWYFYFERILWFKPPRSHLWTEATILFFALIGCWFAFRKNGQTGRATARFFIIYTVTLAAVYSLISYKTPWCALGFWFGAIVVAGYGAGRLLESATAAWQKAVVIVLILAGVAQLCWMSWRGNFVWFADPRNPYVYSQTSPDILRLVETVKGIAKVHPEGNKVVIKVASPDHDYWPLPWYLRGFENVGWYEKLPDEPLPPIIIANAKAGVDVDEKTNKEWLMVGLFEMRPRVFFELFVEFKWWEKYVMSKPKPKDE